MNDTLTIRLDKKTKENARKVLNSLGLDLSTAINIYLKQIIRKGGIPFMIEEPTEELKQALNELEDFEKHPDKYKGYDNVDEMFKELDAEITNNGKNHNPY